MCSKVVKSVAHLSACPSCPETNQVKNEFCLLDHVMVEQSQYDVNLVFNQLIDVTPRLSPLAVQVSVHHVKLVDLQSDNNCMPLKF